MTENNETTVCVDCGESLTRAVPGEGPWVCMNCGRDQSRGPLHAHVETYSTDCDGALSGGFTLTMNDDETADDFGDIKFHERVLSHVVNTYSLNSTGVLTVTRLSDGDVRLSWSEPTDEGHRSVEATICTDPCDLGEESWRRDHQAEAAGY